MLVLSRKKSERIIIGDDIELMVVSIKGGRVKLAIQAPQSVPIHRAEGIAKPARDERSRPDSKIVRK